MIRRAVGLLAGLFMFHLMLVGSDLVCLTHGTHEAHARALAHQDTAGHSDQHGSQAPCDVPARADCCTAPTSCSTNIAVRAQYVTASVDPPQARAIAGAVETPLSRIEAPDPPPPKA